MIVRKEEQAYGEFNGGAIIENKPIGFNREGGKLKPYSNLFYWANAEAIKDSTIGLHPHQGFEIMSFILSGEVRHYDTKLNKWITLKEGDVQIIQAGNGISHSEHMEKGSRMFQIWLDPGLEKTLEQPAQYADYKANDFPVSNENENDFIHYAGRKNGIIEMDSTHICIQKITCKKSLNIAAEKNIINSAYILSGNFTFDESHIQENDFIVTEPGQELLLHGHGEIFLIQSSAILPYATYGEIMQKRMRQI